MIAAPKRKVQETSKCYQPAGAAIFSGTMQWLSGTTETGLALVDEWLQAAGIKCGLKHHSGPPQFRS
jgi:hypothetical protein